MTNIAHCHVMCIGTLKCRGTIDARLGASICINTPLRYKIGWTPASYPWTPLRKKMDFEMSFFSSVSWQPSARRHDE